MKKLIFGVLLLLVVPVLFSACKKDTPSMVDPSGNPDDAFYEAFSAAPVEFDGYERNEFREAQSAVRRCRGQYPADRIRRKECVIPIVTIYIDKATKKIDDLKAALEELAEKATDSANKYEAVQKFVDSRKKVITMHRQALDELAD